MNLFCCIPVEHDATSFYRALQPISQLRKIMPGLQIFHAGKEITMSDLAHMDVAFLQRPIGPEHLQLIELCKKLKVKVWVDYDDHLFSIPKSNPAHAVYDNDRTKKALKEIMNESDVISVSTKKLGVELAKTIEKEKKIHVIPNAFNDYLLKEKPVFRPHNVVMWRGTASHQGDLLSFSPHIIDASRKNEKWLFNFMGYNPYFIVDELGKQGMHTQAIEILKYHEVIRKTYPNLCIVTLMDTTFNRCKSNIAWIEATYAGAVTLAPQWEEWERPGVLTYEGQNDFGKLLNNVLKNDYGLQQHHKSSWSYIENHLRLSSINHLRINLLKEVMDS